MPRRTFASTRLLLGSVVACVALLLAAWKSTMDWLMLLAFGALFGLPEAAKILKYALRRKPDACSIDRPIDRSDENL